MAREERAHIITSPNTRDGLCQPNHWVAHLETEEITPQAVLTKLKNTLPQDVIEGTSSHGLHRPLEELMKEKKITKSYKLTSSHYKRDFQWPVKHCMHLPPFIPSLLQPAALSHSHL